MELIAEKEITTKGGTSRIMNISVTYHVIDADSGEFLEVQTLGEGMDNGDKTAYKAMTGAFKYAQRQAFMIPTGDDPDQVSSDELSNTSLQQKPVSSQESRQKETGSTNGHVCEECQNPITQKVASYSKKNMGRSLCMPCQKKHKVASGE
ncbi:MAG: single-stranded DNA-binding protein, partial [Ruminococcaceae bacterium]|nr:single-stranded DNA-binding protein [Oscillospiraceae bacterium]